MAPDIIADDFKWYVLKVISNQEKKAKQYIEAELRREKREAFVRQIVIPTEKVMVQKAGKREIKEKALFPGYIMIEAIMDGEIVHLIRNLQPVMGFPMTKADGIPTPMAPSEVTRMLGKMDAVAEQGLTYEISFLRDEPVKITDGPFAGFNGTISEINEEKKKLTVIVKIFGRSQPVELSYTQVEKE